MIIVRHGKAEADSPSGRDEDRRLKKRGERQARWLGEQFAQRAPALILSSGHERAIATARLIHQQTGSELRHEAKLELGYVASDALGVIAAHADGCGDRPLMIVGHNPQLGQLLWVLTQGMPVEESDLRTGEAVVLDFDPADAIGKAAAVARVRMPDEE